jgi:hypothetical protein
MKILDIYYLFKFYIYIYIYIFPLKSKIVKLIFLN